MGDTKVIIEPKLQGLEQEVVVKQEEGKVG
jgi:hypothetical protein